MSNFARILSVHRRLEEKEVKLRTVIESLPSGILMIDRSGSIVLSNSEAEKMFGYEKGELVGQLAESLIPFQLQNEHPFILSKMFDRLPRRETSSVVKKDGTEIPIEIRLNHVVTEQENFVIASLVDITEIKNQEEKFRVIIESVPNGIIMTDSNGMIRLGNSEALRMFGYEANELLGKSVETLVPVRYRSTHVGDRNHYREHPQKRQMGAGRHLTGLRKDGTEIPVEIGLSPIESLDGIQVLASIVDITERKAIDDKLHRAYEEVQQKNQEMEQFVYTVSHDLKAPLVTSISFIGFLKEDIEAQNFDEVTDSLVRLEKAHRRMQELIDDLLELSRIGRLELHYEEINLTEILRDTLETFAERSKSNKVEINIANNLPIIKADRKRISQLFENIIGNAIKYTSDVACPKIEIFCRDTYNEVQICVRDNGPGIDPQFHEKIFGLFQRLDSSKEGTGVGLTIASRIMRLHKGKIWLNSELGKGAEFWLSFPKSLKTIGELEV